DTVWAVVPASACRRRRPAPLPRTAWIASPLRPAVQAARLVCHALFHDLEEGLILADHPEFAARPLLDRLQLLLEISDLRLQGPVAFRQQLILLFLRHDGLFQLP